MNTTSIAKAALEWWRAHGDKSRDRLRALVLHFCVVNGEPSPDDVDRHMKSAVAALYPWE
jgi:hypothetical protein